MKMESGLKKMKHEQYEIYIDKHYEIIKSSELKIKKKNGDYIKIELKNSKNVSGENRCLN